MLPSSAMSETRTTNQVCPVQKTIQEAIEESGCVAIITSQSARGLFLYTVGNTPFQLPELLIFCEDQSLTVTYNWLQKFCQFMQETNASPHPHRELTFLKQHYYPILMDGAHVNAYASVVGSYYNNQNVTMLQLIRPDSFGHYPHEREYDRKALLSPYLRSH